MGATLTWGARTSIQAVCGSVAVLNFDDSMLARASVVVLFSAAFGQCDAAEVAAIAQRITSALRVLSCNVS